MPAEKPFGQINFYPASFALQNAAEQPSFKGFLVLVDSRDTNYKPTQFIQNSIYPYFDAPDFVPKLHHYPYDKTDWLKYMRLQPGAHRLYLLDTSRTILDSATVDLSATTPAVTFFADNLGKHRILFTQDPFTPEPGKMAIRIVNLSPFDGDVFITLNKVAPTAFPATTRYGDHTGFIPLSLSGPEMLNIKAYRKGEATQPLARTVLDVSPGHAYTLLLSGYTEDNPGTYTDPRTGNTVTITPGFTITAIKNY